MSNPVPSDKISDGKLNFESLDKVVNGEEIVTTRTGKQIMPISMIVGIVEQRKDTAIGTIDGYVAQVESSRNSAINTINQAEADVQQELQDAIARTGYNFIGEFEDGGTLESRVDALRFEGEWYRWDGALPKVVPTASTPSAEGGVGSGAWVSVGDAALRSDLNAGAADIGGNSARDISDRSMRSLLASGIRSQDIAQIFSKMRFGELNFVALGDSITAGSGSSGHATYGEVNPPINQAALNLFAFNLANQDPQFIRVDTNQVRGVNAFTSASSSFPVGSLPFDSYQLRSGTSDEVRILAPDRNSVSRDVVTVYILQRSADEAARFTIENRSSATDALFDSEVVDTWEQAPIYAGSPRPIQGRVRAVRVPITAGRNSYFRICEAEVIDRGNGVPASGSAVILGIARGTGVDFLNLAVSSTTLKEDSADNVMRGVSTSERLAKALSFGANAFYVAFGTNDSKSGVSTPNEFRNELRALVEDIRSSVTNAPIILATAPRGLASPYLDNPIYNQVVREVAAEKETSLFDVESISDAVNIYADNVHPSRSGYDSIASALSGAFGLSYRKWYNYNPELPGITEVYSGMDRFLPTTNLSGTNQEVYRLTINTPPSTSGRIRLKSIIKTRYDQASEGLTICVMSIIGYTEQNAVGQPSSEVTLDSTRNNFPSLSGEINGQSVLLAEYQFSTTPASVDVIISGRGIRMPSQPSGGLQSSIQWEWIDE